MSKPSSPVSKKPRLELPTQGSPKAVPPKPVSLNIEPLNFCWQKILGYWRSRKEDKFWDVYLVFDGGEQLLCSKRDLCIMSSYFATMFEGDFVESSKTRVPMKDVASSVMEMMVESYYTRKVSPHQTPRKSHVLAVAGHETACERGRFGARSLKVAS